MHGGAVPEPSMKAYEFLMVSALLLVCLACTTSKLHGITIKPSSNSNIMFTINARSFRHRLPYEAVQSSAPTQEFALPVVLPVHMATREKSRGWIFLIQRRLRTDERTV